MSRSAHMDPAAFPARFFHSKEVLIGSPFVWVSSITAKLTIGLSKKAAGSTDGVARIAYLMMRLFKQISCPIRPLAEVSLGGAFKHPILAGDSGLIAAPAIVSDCTIGTSLHARSRNFTS